MGFDNELLSLLPLNRDAIKNSVFNPDFIYFCKMFFYRKSKVNHIFISVYRLKKSTQILTHFSITWSDNNRSCFLCLFVLFIFMTVNSRVQADTIGTDQKKYRVVTDADIIIGAKRMDRVLPLLAGKRVGLVVNNTSVVCNTHLVDSLFALKVDIVKIFSPEHGFRGDQDAGETVESSRDHKTGIPVVSLYGEVKKPKQEDLKNVDVLVFDIQDVGARFYTYISTMSLCMEAAAEAGVEFVVLDRPNPNGFYVDGPVLKPGYESFVGMHQIPVVHGMTIGEYALMVNEEGWLADSVSCRLKIIPMLYYKHTDLYQLPVAPSPNLRTMESVYLYPSLCLFEGSVISIGRGTDKPFQVFGHPCFDETAFSFVPDSSFGAKKPLYKGESCNGYDLTQFAADNFKTSGKVYLYWLNDAYRSYGSAEDFFNNYFDRIVGSQTLRNQIIQNYSEDEIRKSWHDDLNAFKKIRKKYLLYEDFE